MDSSISDTIRTCIALGNHRAANRVKNEFKVRILINKATVISLYATNPNIVLLLISSSMLNLFWHNGFSVKYHQYDLGFGETVVLA